MAAVAKAQQYAAQQHTTLRLPLVRLYNEVETFRYRAFTDTFLTVRKMEKSRTEYRGALLWMKNVSMELDPDATRKLEKFRRVQAQVKKTKTKFDRLKTDAIQKIDLLSASRCNMFSHVLVNYQRTLIQFWEKTARTFNAVSDSFKGYQYYEFNIIKDLVEPSKKVADIVNKSKDEIEKLEKVSQKLEQEIEDENKSKLISFDDLEEEKKEEEEEDKPLDEVNQLIDLMTLNEANSFNEQLKELEQLEEEKKKRKTNNTSKDKLESIKLLNDSKLTFDFSASSISKVFTRTSNNNNNGNEKTDLVNLDFNNLANATNTNTQSPNAFSSFNELINSKNDEFEREWQSAFQNNNNNNNNSTKSDLSSDDFGNFVTASQSFSSLTDATTTPIKSLFSTELFLNKTQQPNPTNNISSSSSDDKSKLNKQETNKNSNNKSNWYDLFAELDPLKNPDAIGSLNGLEEERNC